MLVPNGGHFELPEDWCVGDLPNSGNGVSVRTESLHHRQVIKYLETQCFSLRMLIVFVEHVAFSVCCWAFAYKK